MEMTQDYIKSAAESTGFSTKKILNVRGKLHDLGKARVMGILNVTRDSFYDGGQYVTEVAIAERVERMLKDGAWCIDVGAYSTRPGAPEVPEADELRQAVFATEIIARHFPGTLISVDTFRSSVARACAEAGAGLINDISGGDLDAAMFDTVAQLGIPYILMHTRGTPENMARLTQYDDLVKDVLDTFHPKVHRLTELGVKDVIVDPGFGFAKTVEQNFSLLGRLGDFRILERPLLVGLSRKSMVWRTLEVTPAEALNGSTVLHTVALLRGANILRVHDVREAVEAVKLVGCLGV